MTYHVKEIFYTLQGEGYHAGRAAVFCRFSGCNLWSGRERDRATAACRFCDTDFIGTDGTHGGKFNSAAELATAIAAQWPTTRSPAGTLQTQRFVVLTGGEPLLQIDAPLIQMLHAAHFEVAVETNGSLAAPPGIDWLCVSPKAGIPLVQRQGDELKVVVPQPGLDLEQLATLDFAHFRVQPMDCAEPSQRQTALAWATQWCLEHPRWRLSLQTHKILGIR